MRSLVWLRYSPGHNKTKALDRRALGAGVFVRKGKGARAFSKWSGAPELSCGLKAVD